MGFEPTNGSLGSYCLTTWRHPLTRIEIRGTPQRIIGSGARDVKEQGTGNRGTGNRGQGTGDRGQGTGNRGQGTGNRE